MATESEKAVVKQALEGVDDCGGGKFIGLTASDMRVACVCLFEHVPFTQAMRTKLRY